MKYLLDTDIVNYILKNIEPVTSTFKAKVLADSIFYLSPFVHFEITRYQLLKNASQVHQRYVALINNWEFASIEAADWNTAAQLWAKRHAAGKPIEDSDLLIAVSALKADAILVTNNTRHFDDLGLTVENWTDG